MFYVSMLQTLITTVQTDLKLTTINVWRPSNTTTQLSCIQTKWLLRYERCLKRGGMVSTQRVPWERWTEPTNKAS